MFKDLTINSHRRRYSIKFFKEAPPKEIQRLSKSNFLIIDEKVNDLYPIFASHFSKESIFVIESKESHKTLESVELLVSFLLKNNFKRNQKIIGVGGGIIQDLVSFVSSILYRGVDYVLFPTTLLAQADSCIGSKSSINFLKIKNLLGTFYPPAEIYCCFSFLETLEARDILSGIGEILHYLILKDRVSAAALMIEHEQITSGNFEKLYPFIFKSLAIKKEMIEKDEFDQKERRVFNYGHTFGHALETHTNYKLSHGLAVTLGMDVANYVSYKFGFILHKDYLNMKKLLEKNLPSFKLKEVEILPFCKLLQKDKKNTSGNINMVIPTNREKIQMAGITDFNKLCSSVGEYFEV